MTVPKAVMVGILVLVILFYLSGYIIDWTGGSNFTSH